MKKKMVVILLIMLLSLNGTAYAAEELDGWQYEKEVFCETDEAYQSFFLDAETYRYAQRDLSDLRIVDDAGEFVPYYIHNEYLSRETVTRTEYDTERISAYTKFDDKYMDFRIVWPDKTMDIQGNELLFDVGEEDFLVRAKVYGGYDNQKWHLIKEDNLYRTGEADKLHIKLDAVYKYEYYRLVFLKEIEDIPVEALTLVYDQKDLVHEQYQASLKKGFRSYDEEGDTIVLIDNKDHLRIYSILINANGAFNREYAIYYKDGADEDFRQAGYGEIYQLKLDDHELQDTEIELNRFQDSPITADTIMIRIINRDDRPIDLYDLDISYYVDKVVFEKQDGERYRLLFGSEDPGRVSYDIQDFKKQIEGQAQGFGSLSAVEMRETAPEPDRIDYRLILNVVMVIVSVLLVGVIIRKTGFKNI